MKVFVMVDGIDIVERNHLFGKQPQEIMGTMKRVHGIL